VNTAIRCLLLLVLAVPDLNAKDPTPTDDRLVIELVAREPEIVTPTGIAVDEAGRVWAIENNTHERPANYKGPASDRVRIFSDFDAGGRARRITTFAEGFRNAMALALGKDGAVFLATRADIYLLRDKSGDGTADERRVIVRLETSGQYPHNGLSGFAFDALGNLYFALGENLGAPYKLIGSDGTTLQGGGEGGSIYRCRPDGTSLVRIATGFWNTFNLTIDGFGRLFAVDNDPDSRGPCRLMHIVIGGDYGYRFRNGRKGLHPFTAWNGELPATLPMVAGTAEAPSGIVAYESTGLPAEYRGDLISTSWGDHVVERFRLAPRGASFTSQAQTLVRGGEDFRPVGIAVAPDGSLYLSDWVDKSYPVHGKGRIWRIRMKKAPLDDGLRASKVTAPASGGRQPPVAQLRHLLNHPRREIRAAAGEALVKNGRGSKDILASVLHEDTDIRARLQALWAAAKLEQPTAAELVVSALGDSAPEVRGEAARLLGAMLPAEPARRDESRLLALATKDASPYPRLQAVAQLRTEPSLQAIVPVLADNDPFLAGAALEALGRPGHTGLLLTHADATNPKVRLGVLLALRRAGEAGGRGTLPKYLEDPDPGIRRAAIQWVGEERLQEYAPLLKPAAAQPPVTREVFEALLASQEFLAGVSKKPLEELSGEVYVAQVVRDAGQAPALRALALRMLRPDHPALTAPLLRQFLDGPDRSLRHEAAWTLALRSDGPSQDVLRGLAGDSKAGLGLRAEAILGLADSAGSPASRSLLLALLDTPVLRRDALRSLRAVASQADVARSLREWWEKLEGSEAGGRNGLPDTSAARRELAGQLLLALRAGSGSKSDRFLQGLGEAAGRRPQTEVQWRAALAGGGDAAAGERVFFHPNGPRCFACHRVDGRGGSIGPDLTRIAAGLQHDRLIESILTPSKEIAPQFVAWHIGTRDGKVRTGVIVDEGPNSTITVGDAAGKLEVINRIEIEERHALITSIMPDNLVALMTPLEFRDLVAYLETRK
jgi:putative membrane-bound dehydrogenase-like protein